MKAHDLMNLQRTKHARSNGTLLPEGYSVGRVRWEKASTWRVYHHSKPIRDFTGPRSRLEAIAWCWKSRTCTAAPHPADDVDEATLAVLRAHREDARR